MTRVARRLALLLLFLGMSWLRAWPVSVRPSTKRLSVCRFLSKEANEPRSSRAIRKAKEREQKRRKRVSPRTQQREAESLVASLASLAEKSREEKAAALRRLCSLRRPTTAMNTLKSFPAEDAVPLGAVLASALASHSFRQLLESQRLRAEQSKLRGRERKEATVALEDAQVELEKWQKPLSDLLDAARPHLQVGTDLLSEETDAWLRVYESAAKGGLMADVQSGLQPLVKETLEQASSTDADPEALWRRQIILSRALRKCAMGFASAGEGERATRVMETLAKWTDARRHYLYNQIPETAREREQQASIEDAAEEFLSEDDDDIVLEELSKMEHDDEDPEVEGLNLAGDDFAARLIVKFGRLGLVDGIAATCRAAGVAYPVVGRFKQNGLPILLPGISMDKSKVGKTRQILGVGPRVQTVVHSALMRTIEFVKGAVSVETLPDDTFLPEIAFVGRSNVGKSSLLNMVSGRAALAYSSKTPGKTQQFNYYHVNKNLSPSVEFLLVDLPGYGYAKVSRSDRRDWLTFTDEFIRGSRREGGARLALLLHLIDGRHGPVGQDIEMMKVFLGANQSTNAAYVIVLTKLDKRNAEKNLGTAVAAARDALREAGYDNWMDIPVIASSAASRVGRDSIWMAIHGALKKWSEVHNEKM